MIKIERTNWESRQSPKETRQKLYGWRKYTARQSPPPCVYCGLNSHRSSDCTKVLDIASRREYLARNKLCYNWASGFQM